MKGHMMKKNLIAISLSCVAASAALASVPFPTDSSKLGVAKPATKAAPSPVRGGIYEVQPQLRAVEAASAAGAKVEGKLGSMLLVRQPAAVPSPGQPAVTAGTVVKNRLTGQLGYYSGNLSVVLKDRQQAAALQQRFGLSLVSAGAGDLVLFKAPANADLKKLKSDIAATGLTREVRLDLVAKRYQPE
jgi:Open reading frame 2 N-terminal domain